MPAARLIKLARVLAAGLTGNSHVYFSNLHAWRADATTIDSNRQSRATAKKF